MARVSRLRWFVCWAVAGIVVTAVLLAIFSISPASWHRNLEVAFLVLCPPSIVLMAAEACQGWLSWCSAQFVLLAAGLNSLLYAVVGMAIWFLLKVLPFHLGRSRGAA